ncbi:MAG: extracellular solute-binding protein [Candidatus Rokubacteria bacterium]|nr:extracellular solute-binding protein [Candidatus Rokubacteria bacterium]
MTRRTLGWAWLAVLPLGLGLFPSAVAAQGGPAIETELTILATIPKRMSDAAIAAFKAYARERWSLSVTVHTLTAGTPIAYGRIVEWKGRPQADVFWGGESGLYDDLAAKGLLVPLAVPAAVWDRIPADIGKPKPIPLKDAKRFWVGSAAQVWGLVYNERLYERLGLNPPREWDDLFHPKLKGLVAQCAPSRSSSSHALYEVFLQELGQERGWQWLTRLASQTGIFTARSRDVPNVVARGEFAVGFAVPSIGAFDERLAGHPIRFVFAKNAYVAPEVWGVLAGAPHPRAAQAFVEFMLTEAGQRAFMGIGLHSVVPGYRLQGPPGSVEERAVEFMGGVRSIFDLDVQNVYDDKIARARYQEVNQEFRRRIESNLDEIRRKP